jgi:hypothetical protein
MRGAMSSVAIRQALLTAALVLLAVLGFAAASIQAIGETAHATLLRTVDTDIAGLADIAAAGGLPELESRIADRMALNPSDEPAPLYLLTAADGRRMAGNLRAMPAVDPATSEAGEVNGMIVRATRLKGGATLAVGRSLEPVAAIKAKLWRIFGWAALATLAASLGVGTRARRRRDRAADRPCRCAPRPDREAAARPARDQRRYRARASHPARPPRFASVEGARPQCRPGGRRGAGARPR